MISDLFRAEKYLWSAYALYSAAY